MDNGRRMKIEQVLQDLNMHHNHSIWHEVCLRNKGKTNDAIFYRDNHISYEEMFQKIDSYCAALKAMGYAKGDELPVCMSITPEFVYLFLAISRIGAKINTIGDWFDQQYLIDILNCTGSKYIFMTDDNVDTLQTAVLQSDVETMVVFSLADSLPDGRDPYAEIDCKFKCFEKRTPVFNQTEAMQMLDHSEFMKLADAYRRTFACEEQFQQSLDEDVSLDDDFTITYTSGTTDPCRPKAVLHPVRSYMTLARFKDADISGMGQMKGMTVLAHFPTHVHAGLTTSIVDPLFENCTIAAEPIYDKDFFIHALLINKPNFACAGTGFWCGLGKLLTFDERYKNLRLPFLYIATVTGEGMSPGEEKFFNAVSKQHRFGTDRFPFSFIPVTFSIGGGTSESSGVLVTLFKKYQELRPGYLLSGKPAGLTPLGCCDVQVIREDGSNCKTDEVGSIVLSGPCTMKGYYYQPELTQETCFKDARGKLWLRMGAYGSLDQFGSLRIRGRMSDVVQLHNGKNFPLYKIEEAVYQSKADVMSCTVVRIEGEKGSYVVVHVEPQPRAIVSKEDFLAQVALSLRPVLPGELYDALFIRYRDNVESFPIAPSGKRDIKALADEGITFAILYCNIRTERD